MSGFDERLFFEHDLATPLSNLQGAVYLLRLAAEEPSPDGAEALEILEKNVRTLEKMLHWYWETRRLAEAQAVVPPWPAARLCADLSQLVVEYRLPLPGPETGEGMEELWLDFSPEVLRTALIGAALTLRAASGGQPRWRLDGAGGVLHYSASVPGVSGELDVERLFRKLYWPPADGPVAEMVDPGFPYLAALLQARRGGCELVCAEGRWTLEAWLPGTAI